MTFVERRTDQHVIQRPPSPEEVRRALAAAGDHPDPNLQPLLACLADTGARLGEALALRLSDLDASRCADQPYSPTKMSKVVREFFTSLEMDFTAKSLRAFVVTTWRKARVPDDVLRGRIGHDDATPVTDRHYHYREEVADRQETDHLVGVLLYANHDPRPDPSPGGAEVISLHAVRAKRRSG